MGRRAVRAVAAAARTSRLRAAVATSWLTLAGWLGACGGALAGPEPALPPVAAARVPEQAAASADAAQAAGAALRAGTDALAAGQLDEGVRKLAQVEEQHALVGDAAALLAARALLDARRSAEAVAVLDRFAARGRAAALESDLERVRGEAERARGRDAAARAAFGRALDATDDPARRAVLLRDLAELAEDAGEPAEALRLWESLWRLHPASPAARGSPAEIRRLAQSLDGDPRDAAAFRERGDRLYDAGLRADALDAYDEAVARGLAGEAAAAVRRRRAHALFSLRRYDEAARAFEALGSDAEAEIYRARAIGRGGDRKRAIALLEASAEKRPGAAGAEARWYAGLLYEIEDQPERAWPHFEAVLAEATDPDIRGDAGWRLGWAAFQGGRHAEARERFRAIVSGASGYFDRLRARYWAARAGQEAGQGAPGDEMRALHAEAAFSYYGHRAERWLREHGEPVAPEPPPPLAAGTPALGLADLARAQALVAGGAGDLALDEVERLESQIRGLDDVVQVGALYGRAGAFSRGIGLAIGHHGEALARGPAPGDEALWRVAWPTAFGGLVARQTAGRERLEPALVLALMREESSFRPAVSSPAGARGLMQLMPATAAEVARKQGLGGFRTELLYEPAVNVRLGVAYLDGLVGRFPGRPAAAIGGYNAGPGAVGRWLAERPGEPEDQWIENIPYQETRNYVKRVLRSRQAYQALYGDRLAGATRDDGS